MPINIPSKDVAEKVEQIKILKFFEDCMLEAYNYSEQEYKHLDKFKQYKETLKKKPEYQFADDSKREVLDYLIDRSTMIFKLGYDDNKS